MAKQLIRITEEDLNKMVENSVRRALEEGNINEYGFRDGMKDLGKFALAGGIGTAALATDNPLSRGIDRQFADQEQMGRASQVDRDEMERNRYLDGLEKDGIDTKTISWNDANQFESKIVSKAITESINDFVNETINEIGDTAKGQYMLGRLQGRQMNNGNRDAAMNTDDYAYKARGNRTPNNFQNYDATETSNQLGYNDERNPQHSQNMLNAGGSIGNYQANVRNNYLKGVSKF